ncbi:hypothetical protein NIES2104_43380 [Leptolyngbya sp. NIES-2104]|nr:hypothetical protein NIES2104_43380 [Leptolyngbya sp. NIES-2104]
MTVQSQSEDRFEVVFPNLSRRALLRLHRDRAFTFLCYLRKKQNFKGFDRAPF